MEDKINILKKSAAQTLIQQNRGLLPEGRPMGNKKFVKPKFWKRQADVVSR